LTEKHALCISSGGGDEFDSCIWPGKEEVLKNLDLSDEGYRNLITQKKRTLIIAEKLESSGIKSLSESDLMEAE
jgi:hypothetical protein